jgi:hypothetical protein
MFYEIDLRMFKKTSTFGLVTLAKIIFGSLNKKTCKTEKKT